MRLRPTAIAMFVVGFLLLQAAWLLTVPPFRGSDEFDHAYRAASVARGEWAPTQQAENGRGALVTVPAGLVEAAEAQCSSLVYTGPDNCSPVSRQGDEVVIASAASSYNPVLYAVIGTITRPLDGAGALYAMRAVAGSLCLVFLGLAAWCARGSWYRASFVVALSPVLAYSTIVVAPNGLEMAAGAALWTSLLRLVDDDSCRTRSFWIAVASTCVLLTLRLLGPVLALLILAAVLTLRGERLWTVLRERPRRTCLALALLVGVGVASVAWIANAGQLAPIAGETGAQEIKPLFVVVWAAQTIAAFPLRDQTGPGVVYVAVGTLVLALWVAALRVGASRERLTLTAVTAVALLGPVALTLLTREAQGVSWQGRYGLPFSMGVVLVAGVVLDRRQFTVPPVVAWASGAVLAVGTAASLLKIRADELQRPASAGDDSWWAPPSAVLVLMVVAGTALLVGWVLQGREPEVVRVTDE